MKSSTLLLLYLCYLSTSFAQSTADHAHQRAIHFPDVPGYLTIVSDFHQHTVFSDGSVWPDIRIQEALRDSVDVISLTEHLEYQPHSEDLPHPDRNRAYELAEQYARPYNLLVIPGAEITRKMPPGHTNAIFIEDANKLLIEDSLEVFIEANRQGAFVFSNHPNWIAQRRDGVAFLNDFHRYLIDQKLLHGIEVVNDLTFSDEALQIAIDHGLTIMGTSDIHGLVDWQYEIPHGGHRPVTLIFAPERTPEALKEALFAGRTVVWFRNTLIGYREHLLPLINSSLRVSKAAYQGISSVLDVTIYNDSDVEYLLATQDFYNFHDNAGLITLHPNTTTTFSVKTLEQLKQLELHFEVMNAITAPRVHPSITIPVTVD
ncbi:Sb-PDE family phosphodiesterase [Lewinella cohaerens]|uniref:Sb-PDE family phosphodiesterase n=1 Tax=Lewinella cohaerens TaxID=70995 RepID=UPI0003708C8A|nr:Sb-PDE family phosphodiesterase [Lewinella cohaerens]